MLGRRYSINFRYFWFVFNVLFWTIIFASLGIVVSLFEWRGKFMSWVAKTWSKLLLKIGGMDYKVVGLSNLDPNGNYLFVANHESGLDIPLVFATLPYHLVAIAKIELKRIPSFGWSMIAGGHFFVDRKNKIKALKSLSIAKKSMAKNPRSIIIYPEGTRSKDGEIGLFKKGGFVLAMEMNLPVVPIALCGTFESFGKNKMTFNKNNLELRIGKPFQTSSLTYEDRNQFVDQIRNEVIELKSSSI